MCQSFTSDPGDVVIPKRQPSMLSQDMLRSTTTVLAGSGAVRDVFIAEHKGKLVALKVLKDHTLYGQRRHLTEVVAMVEVRGLWGNVLEHSIPSFLGVDRMKFIRSVTQSPCGNDSQDLIRTRYA